MCAGGVAAEVDIAADNVAAAPAAEETLEVGGGGEAGSGDGGGDRDSAGGGAGAIDVAADNVAVAPAAKETIEVGGGGEADGIGDGSGGRNSARESDGMRVSSTSVDEPGAGDGEEQGKAKD